MQSAGARGKTKKAQTGSRLALLGVVVVVLVVVARRHICFVGPMLINHTLREGPASLAFFYERKKGKEKKKKKYQSI